ncbi:hypothetical protein WN943_002047 [Citrus x changshan-huyou]
MIPHQLGNLSNLQYLDVTGYWFELYVDSFSWLSGLSLLEHFHMSWVNLTKASDWLLSINSLSSLKELKLSYCRVYHLPPLSSANISSLNALDLSGNYFNDTYIPSWVFGLSHLVFLDLGSNKFAGQIPSGLGNLTSLGHLDLSLNQFNSTKPGWLSKLNGLKYLSLRGNSFQGTISSIGLENLTSIKTLDIAFNEQLGGKIPNSFARFCKLRVIDVSYVNLSQDISQVLDIFSACVADALESLFLSSCQIYGHLTNQLGRFKNLRALDLSNNTVNGSIPLSLGQIANLESLDLSNNKLNGTVSEIHFLNLTKLLVFCAHGNLLVFKINPNWVPPFQLAFLELRSCHLGPRFPLWLQSQKKLYYLDISSTRISAKIPRGFWNSIFHLSGTIPRCINNFSAMATTDSSDQDSNIFYASSGDNEIVEDASLVMKGFLVEYKSILNLVRSIDISKNNFSGEVPVEVTNLQGLQSLNLSYNLFTGRIPDNIGVMRSIESLDFSANQLSDARFLSKGKSRSLSDS